MVDCAEANVTSHDSASPFAGRTTPATRSQASPMPLRFESGGVVEPAAAGLGYQRQLSSTSGTPSRSWSGIVGSPDVVSLSEHASPTLTNSWSAFVLAWSGL